MRNKNSRLVSISKKVIPMQPLGHSYIKTNKDTLVTSISRTLWSLFLKKSDYSKNVINKSYIAFIFTDLTDKTSKITMPSIYFVEFN